MNVIKKRAKSKTYWVNTIAAIVGIVAANAPALGIVQPQILVGIAIANIVLRELTDKPLKDK